MVTTRITARLGYLGWAVTAHALAAFLLLTGCAAGDDAPVQAEVVDAELASENLLIPQTLELCGDRGLPTCPEGQYCSFFQGACGGLGVCARRPDACTLQYDPVCGCDGETYGNACGAASAGVSVQVDGPCPHEPAGDDSCEGGECDPTIL
jgi:hypothetical protein